MKSIKLALILVCSSMGGVAVHAEQASPNSPDNMVAMFAVSGRCEFLMIADEERPCKGNVINTEYDFGRTGFYFIENDPDGIIVSFSGMGQDQLSPSENIRLQPLDSIFIDGAGLAAVGFCTFENPFVGPARIECSAYLENGKLYSGFFASDGSKPMNMVE